VFGNADRSRAVAGNEALLDQVPVYPGARYRTTWTFESRDGNGWPEGLGPITSYASTRVYAVDGSPARPVVVEWYRARLARRCQFKGGSGYGDGVYFDASFSCGSGSVHIAPSEDALMIRADYNGYGS
jgi:hypothetical protein